MLLLENHDLEVEEVAKLTLEEDYLHGYAKEKGSWYEFKIYRD